MNKKGIIPSSQHISYYDYNNDYYDNSIICKNVFDGVYDINENCHPSDSVLEIYCKTNANLYPTIIDPTLCDCIVTKSLDYIYIVIVICVILLIFLKYTKQMKHLFVSIFD